jgi:hypothetical protein
MIKVLLLLNLNRTTKSLNEAFIYLFAVKPIYFYQK